jgi:multicomponent Na+:H+ antiporter subunit D
MSYLVVLPLLVPLVGAIAGVLAWHWPTAQRAAGLAGAGALLAAGCGLLLQVWTEGIQVYQVGGWPAPFGITLVADTLSATMVVLAGIIGLATVAYSTGTIDHGRASHGYYPLVQILLLGVCGAFLTGDVFNLYVWFEVMLIASFVLVALGGEKAQLEGSVKYVTLNLLSSALLLAAVGLLYGLTGSLNMAELSQRLPELESDALVAAVAFLFLVAFGIKAAAFPLFFWLPASYHTPPVAVSALFAGLLTKVGVYALLRVFTLLFVEDVAYIRELILVVAGLTMVTGVLGAIAQSEMRRLLSFHIVSQIGYLLMGLGLYSLASLAASVFFMIHIVVAKSALFLVSGLVHRLRGTFELKDLGGLYESKAMLAALFLLPALSLAGLPPLSGFFAKLALVQAGLDAGSYAIVAVALAVSILTLFSMMKIWVEAFWKPSDAAWRPANSTPLGMTTLLPAAVLAGLALALGIAAEPVFALAQRAAEQLMDPEAYARAVLEGGTE